VTVALAGEANVAMVVLNIECIVMPACDKGLSTFFMVLHIGD